MDRAFVAPLKKSAPRLESMGCLSLTDYLEVWPEVSQDIDKKYHARVFAFFSISIFLKGPIRHKYRYIFHRRI